MFKMVVVDIMLKALCVSLCLASSLPDQTEEGVPDFIEHVLRIPNPDKVLNSVLAVLEGNRQGTRRRVSDLAEGVDCEDSLETLPEYTESLEDSREREMRQLVVQKHYPICHIERKIRKLNTNEYEYRPAYYEEVKCISTEEKGIEKGRSNEICSSLGFTCIQWNKTIHLTRRRYTSDCWETRTMVIPAGCECMWPVHRLGDMTLHV
ncbi:uncharacterized protein LOC106133891 [Amyelois transitella]|uniref:uncharacterized protein LOC106133891 n=1 Tax=Amyelois transitella TaxID=680683 RepID=UPI00067B347A|nr:unnamed protein product [Amyelois transitella]XP_060809585.1 uncharacterized protein LOC106133891 [Amyelois transitella]